MMTDRPIVARNKTFVIPLSSWSMRPTLLLGWLLFIAALHSGPVYTTKPEIIIFHIHNDFLHIDNNNVIKYKTYKTKKTLSIAI